MPQDQSLSAADAARAPLRQPGFSYEQAFSRNIGWLAGHEQEVLRHKRVAIAGLGGVGGVHLLALTRLGISNFHIADFDSFDLPNFNRQAGASVSTLGKSKLDVMAAQAADINPEIRFSRFSTGVSASNVEAFLTDCDVYVDGLDFFAFEARRLVFAACARRKLPAVTAAPIGMSAALLNFLPGGMTFEEYFDWGDHGDEEKALRFALGLAPAALHRGYLVDESAVDMLRRRTPSTGMACQLCAGMAATEVLKLLLGRGPVRGAPHGLQFDAYTGRLARTFRPGGNRHPLQRLAMAVGRRQLAAMSALNASP
jgi:molybdopterin/thiamine biosynthesis adenylyltransferase